MDKNSLVEVGRTIAKGLQDDGVALIAALWVREMADETWLLWVAPKTFKGRQDFYASLAKVLTKLRAQTGYFEISSVRSIDPASPIIGELRRFGRISPDHPRYLFNENLGGIYLKEAILLQVD